MVTSNKAGRLLNDQLMNSWKENGYIKDFSYVASGQFSGNAHHNLTLSGSQYGESSIAAQILSGLTLFVLPYSVDTKYDIQYTLEDVASGLRYSAAVADSYKTWVELLLMFALPVSLSGQMATMENMGDHLYEQLYSSGAFASRPGELPAREAE